MYILKKEKFMTKVKVALAMSLTALTLSFLPSISYAAWYCACINNKVQKVCQNKYDANYAYWSGGYCSAQLQGPENDKTKRLYALLENVGKLSKFNTLIKRKCTI